MLKPLTQAELPDILADFWPVALDLTRSGYPTYTDGIKTFDDFARQVTRARDESWGEVLLHVHEGADNGLIVVDRVDDDYLSLPVCLTKAHQDAALAETIAYLAQKYAGRTLWLGFAPENAERLAFAKSNGFALLDDTTNWQLPLASWQRTAADARVLAIDREHYAAFKTLWTNEDMYWNAERIAQDMSRWYLFVYEDNGVPVAAVACMKDAKMPEIFGFMYRDDYDDQAHRALLTACLNVAAAERCDELIYFAGAEENAVMSALNFHRVSGYVCYQKEL